MSRNIGGDPNDLSYRYKMPRMKIKVEGKGNGIKTRIVNMTDVATALHRKPEYVTKWFGCELGAQSKCVAKDHLSVVNGKHDLAGLDPLLDAFIEKYVLCPKCKLPETDLLVKKRIIFSICNACGNRSKCDMVHRLAVFILKNPPIYVKKTTKKDKKLEEEEQMYDEAKKLKTKSQDDDWHTDTSRSAAEKRKREANVDRLIVDLDETYIGELYDIIFAPNTNAKEQKKKIRRIQRKENIGNEKRAELLFKICYQNDILTKLHNHIPLLLETCSYPRAQYVIVCQLEILVLEQEDELLEHINGILQAFYQTGVLDEDVIEAWVERGIVPDDQHDQIIEAAQPFLDWLKNAEVE
eukprot:TRINITY_DN312_c0_g2_i3.p1 TRINITY_DN312_c0_g2~~TRINITY_DN312_c0_g2_i3.p1  ORF type:complete len:353 (-),score=135.72 TRINITY_DN312_c0_g2_i3:165-1223(-)